MTVFVLAALTAAMVAAPHVVDTLDIAPVWAGHPVGFHLQTHKEHQLVAFYDGERRMVVGKRALDSVEWQFVELPETIGWDSHNYITMAIDDADYIHLSGNMHVTPLVYFRSTAPMDIASLQRQPMVGEREQRVTYPKFLRGSANELLYCYRDGSSGNGEELYNVYDVKTQQWHRFLDTPLVSGEGDCNAYIIGPVKGPDKRFHICWVWRDHSGCESNHSLSYALSSNLKDWETASGQKLTLPITRTTGDIVDPVPVNGGIINGNTRLGFDSQQRPVVSYHKFDEDGNTQIYNARFEKDRWVIYQTSNWDYRWEFSGGGTIVFEIRVSGVTAHGDGTLRQNYTHVRHGSGAWLLDERDFRILDKLETPPAYPPELDRPQSDFEGIQIRRAGDSGKANEAGIRYFLQWETLPQHRDRPREGSVPSPTMLRLIKMKTDVN